MKKRDIYEHLAHIYLDSTKQDKKAKARKNKLKISLFIFIISLLFVVSVSIYAYIGHKGDDAQIALVVQPEAVKINYDFHAAKKEILSIDLQGIDLREYNSLRFRARKSNYQDQAYLRAELENAFKEKSEVYIGDLSRKWHDYKIDFSEFKKLADFTNIKSLNFIVEEWNVKHKEGKIYIDEVRFVK